MLNLECVIKIFISYLKNSYYLLIDLIIIIILHLHYSVNIFKITLHLYTTMNEKFNEL